MRILIMVLILALVSPMAFADLQQTARINPPAITIDGESLSAEQKILQIAGQPKIPFESISILLPFGESIEGVSVALSDFTTLKGSFDLPPAQLPSSAKGVSIFTSRDPEVYGTSEYYPSKDYDLIHVGRLCGFDIATINVYPYKYNPVDKTLGYYREITVDLTTSSNADVRSRQAQMISPGISAMKRVEALADNPEIALTYPVPVTAASDKSLVSPDDPKSFIIVAGQAYQSLFESYASWKEARGVSAGVYTIESILSEYTEGNDAPENLRAFIIDAYQTWAGSDFPLEFVLLAGDDEIIPIRGCWGHNDYFGTDYYIPCDLYYGCLDGDWNANGNTYYGEETDDPDLFAEVHIGRFPGDNQQDFETMIAKTMQYVDDPWPNLYTALMAGEKLADDPVRWGGDLLDMICDDTAYMPEEYIVTKMYDREGTFSTYAVTQHINSNASALMLSCAHTNYNYLMGWSPYDIDNLANTQHPIFSAGGCHTLAFDQLTSGYMEAVGEHAMFADGGTAVFLGNSRYGFSNWTNFVQELMKGIFAEDIQSIGASLTYARDQLAYLVAPGSTGEIWRWEYYELIFAGDPQIYLINECIDADSDLVCDAFDNCTSIYNPDQEDYDGDFVGDSCDNCIYVSNPDQADSNGNSIGDVCDWLCGDANASGTVDIDDVVHLIAYIFNGGPAPTPASSGDVDCSGAVDIDDVVDLIGFIFSGGNAPCDTDGDTIPDC